MNLNLKSGNATSAKAFFRNHYGKILFTLILVLVLYAIYFIVMALYPTILSVKEIDPSEIPSVQQKIDLNRYSTVSDALEEKASRTPPTEIPDLFKE